MPCSYGIVNLQCTPIWLLSKLLTDPRMFGSLVVSILPTSQVIILVTGSNEYFPWVGVSVTFSTDFGNGISKITFSTWKKILTAYILGVHAFRQLNTTFECNNHCTLGFKNITEIHWHHNIPVFPSFVWVLQLCPIYQTTLPCMKYCAASKLE